MSSSTTTGEAYDTLKEALRDCVSSMPYGMGQRMDKSNIYRVMQRPEIKLLMKDLETESGGAVSEATIREARAGLRGLVVSEIDKARGELAIM